MPENSSITFGDTVRVRPTPATESRGLTGLVGQVYGETTPSVTDVDVIGEHDDYAINVSFDDLDETYWFSPHLLELLDHAPGTEITIDGVPKKWIRTESGEWDEIDTNPARKTILSRIRNLFR